MAEEIDFENGRNSNFEGLVTLTLTFDPAIRHVVLQQSSTSTYITNFIQIEETFCGLTDVLTGGRTDGRTDIFPLYTIRSTFGSRPNKKQVRNPTNDAITLVNRKAAQISPTKCRRCWVDYVPKNEDFVRSVCILLHQEPIIILYTPDQTDDLRLLCSRDCTPSLWTVLDVDRHLIWAVCLLPWWCTRTTRLWGKQHRRHQFS